MVEDIIEPAIIAHNPRVLVIAGEDAPVTGLVRGWVDSADQVTSLKEASACCEDYGVVVVDRSVIDDNDPGALSTFAESDTTLVVISAGENPASLPGAIQINPDKDVMKLRSIIQRSA